MQSISTKSPGLKFICSDSKDEIIVEQPHPESFDLGFRVGGPITNPMTAFVNEDAARLCPLREAVSREESFIDVVGSDTVREILSTITKNSELPDFSLVIP